MRYTVISVDDHLVEPPDMFEGRLPARLQEAAPKVIETKRGHQVWRFDGKTYSQVGMNAVAGRRLETVEVEPFRFDQMRRGCWDIEARLRDMDINGVWASLNFPSMITGFCGRVFSQCSDPELGLAVTRAWNDWLFEEWYSPHPDRIIPMGITFLPTPSRGPRRSVRNAARGFTSVTLPERPHRIGLPSIFDDYWDPVFRACARDRHGDQPPRRILGHGRPPRRMSAGAVGRHPLRRSCPSPPAPNGCGRAGRSGIRR